MRDAMEFEMMLDEVLNELANPEPTTALPRRVMLTIQMQQGAVVSAEAGKSRIGPAEHAPFAAVPQEQSVFASLWSGLCDLLFPAKLPPLVLQSRPIAVVDRMAIRSSYPSTGYAVAAHVLVVFLIGFVVNAQIRKVTPNRESVAELIAPPVSLQAAPNADRIGGGGGQKGFAPVTRGRLPKLMQEQLIAPKTPPLQPPVIAIEPSVAVQMNLKMADNTLPDLGLPNSPVVTGSMGTGRGAGLGSGDGDGIGPGVGGNVGGGVRRVGNGVSAPEVLFQPEPEFSEQARKAKLSGNVEVYLWVDEHGNPTHVRLARGIGMGLDEKAVEAVRQYRFKPAMANGRPVTVEMYVDVVFQIL
jgi:periplasmic protein TonB